MPDRPGLTFGVIKIRRCHRVFFQVRVAGQQGVQARAECKALFCQRDGRPKKISPGQFAVLAVRQLEHAHGAGHADRPPADHGLVKGQGFAIGVQQQVWRSALRRRFTAIKGLGVTAVEVQQKSTATDAAGLRLDQTEHHLHGYRGIYRGAAGFEGLVARISGQRIGRRHGKTPGCPARFGAVSGGCFRLGRRCIDKARRRGATGQQHQPGGAA